MEEKEAEQVRNRILATMNEADFDIDAFIPAAKEESEVCCVSIGRLVESLFIFYFLQEDEPTGKKASKRSKQKKDRDLNEVDVDALSEKDVKHLMKRHHPELQGMVDEYKGEIRFLFSAVICQQRQLNYVAWITPLFRFTTNTVYGSRD